MLVKIPLTTVLGNVGSGKNVFVVWSLMKFPDKMKYTNFELTLPNSKQVTITDLFEIETDKEIFVVFDEGYGDFDNRDSMSYESRFNTYLLNQRRKKKMSIVGISQLNILDVRWREQSRITVFALDRKLPIDGKEVKDDFKYIITDGINKVRFNLPYEEGKKTFKFYNTDKTVKPRDFDLLKERIILKNPTKLKERVYLIIKKLEEKFTLPEKISHSYLKAKFLDLEINPSFEPYVYAILNSRNQ